jgi:hypothetical protein
MKLEQPLPAAPRPVRQTRSAHPLALCAGVSCVPPAAVTVVKSAGNWARVNPLSPLDTTIAWPGWS